MGPRIAVVSDLHVGAGARATDMNPHAEKSRSIDTDYVAKFERFVKERGIQADYLLVPGDITDRAMPDEFELASALLERIATALLVPADRVVFVPGNHDVDWAVMSVGGDSSSNFRRQQRYDPLTRTNGVFGPILRRASPSSIASAPYYCVWTFPDLVVVGINSAHHDGPSHKVHHGLVANETLVDLENFLCRHAPQDDRLRVCLVHHHPILYSDPIAGEPDFSAMTNAPALLELFAKHRIDLVVHGHKHKPNFQVHQVLSHYQLPILGAGSFSYTLRL